MTKIDLDMLLHQRLIDKCKSLYEDDYFPEAALESMKQIELALKEKTGISKKASSILKLGKGVYHLMK